MAFLEMSAPPCPIPLLSYLAFSECTDALFLSFSSRKLAAWRTAIFVETKQSVCSLLSLIPKDPQLVLGVECSLLPYLRSPLLAIGLMEDRAKVARSSIVL